MLFDKFANIVEHNDVLGYLFKPTLHKAKLFSFPYNPEKLPLKDIQFSNEDFFLPFNTVAIEDKKSIVFLQDTIPNQYGWNTVRNFITVSNNYDNDYDENGVETHKEKKDPTDMYTYTINSGTVYTDTGSHIAGKLDRYIIIDTIDNTINDIISE